MMTLPPTIDSDGLARLLHLSPATISRDVTRRPDSLPPFIVVRKKKIWVTLVVLDWLTRQFNRPIDVDIRCLMASAAAGSANQPAIPTLTEMLAAANSGHQQAKKRRAK